MTEENAWTVKADLPTTRYAAVSVVFEDKIWIMGGHIGTEASASVLTYDAEAGAWATAPALPSPRAFCRATTIDGGIHLNDARPQTFQYKNAAWSVLGRGPWKYHSVYGPLDPVHGPVLLG